MMSVTSIRFLVRRAHVATQKSQEDSQHRIGLVLSPGVKLAPQCLARCDQRTQTANVPEWQPYNVTHEVQVMDPFVARERRYRSSPNRLLYSLSRSSVLGADALLGALTVENHMRVLVPSRPWTRLDYSQPHIINCICVLYRFVRMGYTAGRPNFSSCHRSVQE